MDRDVIWCVGSINLGWVCRWAKSATERRQMAKSKTF